MKTITIKVDDQYADAICLTLIGVKMGSSKAETHVGTYDYNIYDNMVITIDDNGKSKTEENNG